MLTVSSSSQHLLDRLVLVRQFTVWWNGTYNRQQSCKNAEVLLHLTHWYLALSFKCFTRWSGFSRNPSPSWDLHKGSIDEAGHIRMLLYPSLGGRANLPKSHRCLGYGLQVPWKASESYLMFVIIHCIVTWVRLGHLSSKMVAEEWHSIPSLN